MDKLSGILPSNARITTVDTSSARAVRSGVHSYGAPVATHDRRPTLAATEMLSISKQAQEMSHRKPESHHALAKETEEKYFANRQAEIELKDQEREEMKEMSHQFQPDEKMHISEDLSNVPVHQANTHGAPASIGTAAQAGSNSGILPHAVERLQSRAADPGTHLSVMA